MIDSRDFTAAGRRAETAVLVPAGPMKDVAVLRTLLLGRHRQRLWPDSDN
jgi:hypothetical protein